jgi:hypothetical protein
MPNNHFYINLEDDKPVVVSKFQVIKEQFNKSLELEKKKYPLSDREKIFVNTINELLDVLDRGFSR